MYFTNAASGDVQSSVLKNEVQFFCFWRQRRGGRVLRGVVDVQGRGGAPVHGQEAGQEGLLRQLGSVLAAVESQRVRRLHGRPQNRARQE